MNECALMEGYKVNTPKTVMIGIIGSDSDALDVLYKGLKHFPSQKVYLLTDNFNNKLIAKAKEELGKLHLDIIPKKIESLRSIENIFTQIKSINDEEKDVKVIINVDCDYMSSCLALSSAFVNGILAIGILNDEIIAYPIMKFSYYSALSEKKLQILQMLFKKNDFINLEEISSKIKMSLPLVSYHINGNLKAQGLMELGLIEDRTNGKNRQVRLSMLGNLMMKGQINYKVD